MLTNIVTGVIGTLISLFIFWKRLKEDYASEIVFRSAFYILLSTGIAFFAVFRFSPEWFLWTELIGVIAGLALSVYVLRMRFYETLEAAVISLLPTVALMFLKDSVFRSSFISFAAFLTSLIFIFVFYYLDLHYKTFSWYRSGKIGFAGLSTLAMIFVVRSAIALIGIPVLSFVGKYEAIASGSAAFVCFLMIFVLARSE